MNKILFSVLALMVISAIGANFYTFYQQKSYDFLVETPCDEKTQSCFVRDCSTGECPPNNLSLYRSFHIEAKNFDACGTDSCLQECESGTIQCLETKCGESEGDICSIKTE